MKQPTTTYQQQPELVFDKNLFSDPSSMQLPAIKKRGKGATRNRHDEIVRQFETEIEALSAPALERIDTATDGDGRREIFVIGNRIGDEVHDQVIAIYGKYLRRYPNLVGELHVKDRRDQPLAALAPIELQTSSFQSYYGLNHAYAGRTYFPVDAES